jgi:hypothetical protein
MKNGRRWKNIELEDPKQFGQQWWDWWHSLQPKTWICSQQNYQTSPTPEMDWSDLHKPGKNGFLLIMMSLIWWGAVSNQEGNWVAAIVDVTDVLTCMQSASGGTLGNEPPKGNLLGGSGTANSTSVIKSKQDDAAIQPSKKKHKVH